jgi:tRNA(Ile)-lysidine synthetase-like protein
MTMGERHINRIRFTTDQPKVDTATNTFAQRVADACPPGHLLAAVSGGPDSTALLLALVQGGRDVTAAHYDHALRPGSGADADVVGTLCAALGVGLIAVRRSEPLAPGSLQASARAARYRFFEDARARSGADWVVLGHTADDAVEGVVLHLLRGSGLAGLRGMPERREPYARPLLRVWRREVEAYLLEEGVRPLRDPANEDRRHARVRVRLDLLPALERDRPGISGRLHRVALTAGVRQAWVERAAAAVTDVTRAPEPVRAEALRQMYATAGGRLPALSRRLIESMSGLLTATEARGLDLPGGIRFTVEGGRAAMAARRGPEEPRDYTLSVRPCGGCDDRSAAHLRPGLELTVGFRKPGLRIRPLGGRGTRKLQDVLTDAKIPRSRRDLLPLVFAEGQLAWVPGLAIAAEFAAEAGGPAEHVMLESAQPSRGVPA